MNPQKQKTKFKMGNRMNCLIGCRNSERIWLMEALQQSLGETQSKEVETLPSHQDELPPASERLKTWKPVVPASYSVFSNFPKESKLCRIWLEGVLENNKGFLNIEDVLPRSKSRAQSGHNILVRLSLTDRNCDKVLSEGCESRGQSCRRCTCGGAGLGHPMDPVVLMCKTKTSQETQRSLQKVLGARRGSLKSLTLTIPWNLEKLVKILSWNHCTSTPHRSETNGISERAGRRVKEGDICGAIAVRFG